MGEDVPACVIVSNHTDSGGHHARPGTALHVPHAACTPACLPACLPPFPRRRARFGWTGCTTASRRRTLSCSASWSARWGCCHTSPRAQHWRRSVAHGAARRHQGVHRRAAAAAVAVAAAAVALGRARRGESGVGGGGGGGAQAVALGRERCGTPPPGHAQESGGGGGGGGGAQAHTRRASQSGLTHGWQWRLRRSGLLWTIRAWHALAARGDGGGPASLTHDAAPTASKGANRGSALVSVARRAAADA
eukprot:278607-Chlamydomonas_euryale.AAC.3